MNLRRTPTTPQMRHDEFAHFCGGVSDIRGVLLIQEDVLATGFDPYHGCRSPACRAADLLPKHISMPRKRHCSWLSAGIAEVGVSGNRRVCPAGRWLLCKPAYLCVHTSSVTGAAVSQWSHTLCGRPGRRSHGLPLASSVWPAECGGGCRPTPPLSRKRPRSQRQSRPGTAHHRAVQALRRMRCRLVNTMSVAGRTSLLGSRHALNPDRD